MACGLPDRLTDAARQWYADNGFHPTFFYEAIWNLIGFALVNASGGEFAAFLSPFTPFTAVWFLIAPSDLAQSSNMSNPAGLSAIRVSAAIGTTIALGLYTILVWRGYIALVRGFDMIMRKQTGN